MISATASLIVSLPVAGGVQVQPVHADPHLVRSEPRVRVKAPRGLRQHARHAFGGISHPVQAERAGQRRSASG